MAHDCIMYKTSAEKLQYTDQTQNKQNTSHISPAHMTQMNYWVHFFNSSAKYDNNIWISL